MKPLFLFLLILAACSECPRCPQPEACPVTLSPEPITQAHDAGPSPKTEPTTAPQVEWVPVDPTTLVGKWRSADGKPLPTFEIVANETGSKTSMNFDIRADKPAHIGCGLYPATGTSFCKTASKVTDAPAVKAEELRATFVMRNGTLLVSLGEENTTRFSGQFVREAVSK